jgi:carbon-monoxide dehydrogenase large subunit
MPRHTGLLTGSTAFVEDQLAGRAVLHAAFVRSPLAHARISHLDASVARNLREVVGVFSAQDLELPPRLVMAVVPEAFARPPLAVDRVRFAGEAVAVVVGTSREAAADGAQSVIVDYDPLPAVVGAEQAARPESPLVWPEHGSNLVLEFTEGTGQGALRDAEVVVKGRFVNQRLAPVPMEPNAILAAPDLNTGGLCLWASTQSPFQVRDFVADCLGLAEDQVRCIAADVGGGFGAKITAYPEHVVIARLAQRLQQPVRWVETRSESFLALAHGRDQIQEFELGATRSGQLVGLRARVLADAGAYPQLGAFLPALTGQMLSGVYQLPRIDYQARAYATNTCPVTAYRGAGRPEATSLLERAMDMLAVEVDIDPAELRRRNLIPAHAFPYETATGAVYDSGDYGQALEGALATVGYEELRAEQRSRRQANAVRLLGIGISTYVEVTGAGSPTEYARVEVRPGGDVLAKVGTMSTGQAHNQAFSQIVARTLGIPADRVEVQEGDTEAIARGDGTSASRSVQIGGTAVLQAAQIVLERARQLAAQLLETDPEVVELLPNGVLGLSSAPGDGLGWTELATAALDPSRLPAGQAPGPLAAETDFSAPDRTYPFGAHVAVVEVDTDTGEARLIRHVAVDDCGTLIDPPGAEAQVHGGVAQGVAQALFEEVVYDQDGTPRTTSLIDYGVPSAGELPSIETMQMETPTPHNPLGAKGIGESGTIGSTPAVQNAVIDALSHLGIRHLDMPLTPEKVWAAIKDGRPSTGPISPAGRSYKSV